MRLFMTILLLSLVAGASFSGNDSFEDIKESLSKAACCQFEFLSVHESGIFETSDTTAGRAYIARGGKYSIMIGDDSYINNGELLYSYSKAQNQVTIEKTGENSIQEEVSFITRLDEFYVTECEEANHEYFLRRNRPEARSLPDSMILLIDSTLTQIERIEYFDQNEDLNIIIFLAQSNFSECDESLLEENFPDSADVVKLY